MKGMNQLASDNKIGIVPDEVWEAVRKDLHNSDYFKIIHESIDRAEYYQSAPYTCVRLIGSTPDTNFDVLGFSKCHPGKKGDWYNYERGLQIALGRAVQKAIYVVLGSHMGILAENVRELRNSLLDAVRAFRVEPWVGALSTKSPKSETPRTQE